MGSEDLRGRRCWGNTFSNYVCRRSGVGGAASGRPRPTSCRPTGAPRPKRLAPAPRLLSPIKPNPTQILVNESQVKPNPSKILVKAKSQSQPEPSQIHARPGIAEIQPKSQEPAKASQSQPAASTPAEARRLHPWHPEAAGPCPGALYGDPREKRHDFKEKSAIPRREVHEPPGIRSASS